MEPSSSNAPVFVPRTVVALERAATRMARRVAAPVVRGIGGRMLAFADRVIGGWVGRSTPTPRVGGVTTGAMTLPRPWWDIGFDDEVEPAWDVAPRETARPTARVRDVTATRPPMTLLEIAAAA